MESSGRTAPESLLREVAHVQRLARAIVRDAQQAQDVAQDTLVVALQRPPRAADDRTLRAWLTKVVRSLARRAWRDERTRTRHESAARREPEGREGRTANSLQQQRELLAAVAGLAEPYRTAITMRFLEGASPRAIARTLGVEPAAVRQRIHRGLSMLRARLQRTHGDARLAVAAIVPWSAWFPVLVQGVSIVATKKLVACGAAVVVAAAFLVPRGDAPQPASNVTAVAPDSAALATSGPLAGELPSARELAPIAANDATTGTLVVDVFAAAGSALADAPVTLLNVNAQRRREPEEHHRPTDASGRARFDTLAPGRWMISVDGRTPPKDVRNLATVRAGETATHEIRLAPGLTLTGVVVDVDGNLVPHARIVAASAGRASTLAVAGRDGGFRITDLQSPSTVQARASGFQPSRDETVSGDGGRAEVRVELRLGGAARTISGRVCDANDRPCAGAKVALVPAAARAQHRWQGPVSIEWQRADDAGEFRHEEAAPGAWIVVAQARDEAVPPAEAEVDVTNADGFVELRSAAGARIRGRVMRGGESAAANIIAWPDETGAGATALVQDLGWRESPRGDGGAFELVGLCHGRVRVRVITDGELAHEEVVDVGAGAVLERDFELPPACPLDVVVRGATDKMLMAMLIPPGEPASELGHLVPLTHGEGSFRGVRPASLDLYLVFLDNKSDMVQLAVRRDVAPAARRVEFELGAAVLPARYVIGRFVDERLDPVAHRVVEVRRTDDPQLVVRRRVATGADGRFRIGPLPPGQYDVLDAGAPEPVVRRFVGRDRDEDVGDVVIRAAR